ncbi:MAG: alpha/beta hydrolase [Mycobacteriales bacterium]
MVYNPGGPGGAGTASLPLVYPLFTPLTRARFDVVTLDPRGIGDSAQLQCFDTPEQEAALLAHAPLGFPVGAQQTQQWIETYAQFDQACAQHGGPIQYHMSTANVARDMDRLRAALGENKLTYYGPSYGSYLGATYANMFPHRIRAIILDGNVPPVQWNDTRIGAVLGTFLREGSHVGSETALQMMLRKCGQVGTDRCAFSAGSPQATLAKYRALLYRLRANPVTLGGQSFTYAFTTELVVGYLAVQNRILGLPVSWKDLADLLQTLQTLTSPGQATRATLPADVKAITAAALPGALSGRLSPALSGNFGPQLLEGELGVYCSESPNPRDPNSYSLQAKIGDLLAPDGFGSVWAWVAEPCAQWQARDADRYTGPFNKPTVPLLVIGILGDPNAPYFASVEMSHELANTRLLTETGGGHTALENKSDCTDGYIDSYLATGALPPVGTVCGQNQQPF